MIKQINKLYLISVLAFTTLLLFPNYISNFFAATLILSYFSSKIDIDYLNIKSLKTTIIILPLFWLILVVFLGGFYSENIAGTLKEGSILLPLILLPLLFSKFNLPISLIKKYFVIGVSSVSIITFLIALHKSKLVYDIYSWEDTYKLFLLEFSYQRFAGHFFNHALYLGLFITISTAFLFEKLKTTTSRKSLISLLVFNSILILLLKSSTASASYFVVFLIGLLSSISLKKIKHLLLSSSITSFFLLVVVFILLLKMDYYKIEYNLTHQIGMYTIGYLISLLAFYLGYKQYKFMALHYKKIIVFAVIFLSASFVYISKETNLLNYKENYSNVNARVGNWKNAFYIIKKSPITGVGAGDRQDLLKQEYLNDGFIVGYNANYNEHNQFLRFWMSSGVLGIGFFILFFIVLIRLAIKNKDYTMLSIVISLILFSLTESWLARQKGVYLLGFILAFYNLKYSTQLSINKLNTLFTRKEF